MNKRVLLISLTLLLSLSLVGVGCPPPPLPVANLALQVNPGVNLVLSERNVVIAAEGLDARGESLLAGLDVTNKELADALHIIASALHEAGLLGPEQWIVMALHPIGDRLGEAELTALADATRQTLGAHLAKQGLPAVEVKIVVLTAELADATHAAGLLPADYVDDYTEAKADMTEAGITTDNVSAILEAALKADPTLEELTTITAAMIDLHEVGATQESIMAVFSLVEEWVAANVSRTLLLEEFTTITAAKADLLEDGIPAAIALAVLREAVQADPKLEELTTITAAMIDVVEEGLSPEEALARIRDAIQVDPTLEKFDDLIEIPEEEDDEVEVEAEEEDDEDEGEEVEDVEDEELEEEEEE